MKKFVLKNFFAGILICLGFFITAFVFIKAASLTATSGTPLTAGNWNDMVKNFFWGSGSGGIYYNGKVGIGTNSPNKDIHIYDTTNNAEIDLQSVAGTNKHWAIYQDKTNSNLYMWNTTNRVSVTTGGTFTVDGTITATNGLCLAGTCKTNWNQVGSSVSNSYTGTCDSAHKGSTGVISDVYKICNGTDWIKIVETKSMTAVGGTISYEGLYTVHTFLSSGTFNVTSVPGGKTMDVLIVAGGGGAGKSSGGNGGSGGGGGGGVVSLTNYSVSVGSYSVTVGNGGVGATVANNLGGNGGNSSFGATTAIGGGGGGGAYGSSGLAGGSGGGSGQAGSAGGACTSGQGYLGGHSSGSNWNSGPGGGGAGGAGGNVTAGTINYGAAGGIGIQSSISGVSKYYAGGGGGGGRSSVGGAGGAGGGGAGGYSAAIDGTAGTPNTGGGGGGSSNGYNGGNGGSGVVIIRYLSN